MIPRTAAYDDAVVQALPRRPLTSEDLADFPDDGHRYELIDGALVVAPAPGTDHQLCLGLVYRVIAGQLPPDLVALLAPYDWLVSPSTVVEPDLVVARRSDLGPKRLERPPLLVVEILSPSTSRMDRGTKRLAYENAGVPAYWIVDPSDPVTVTILQLGDDGTYGTVAVLTGTTPHTDDVLGVTLTAEGIDPRR